MIYYQNHKRTPLSYLGFQQLAPLRQQVVPQACHGARQGKAPDEENGQHDVGEGGRYIYHLDNTKRHHEEKCTTLGTLMGEGGVLMPRVDLGTLKVAL